METIQFLFETPLCEEKILSATPLRWKVGELELKSDLLTYPRYNMFTNLAQSIKLRETSSGSEIPLSRFMQIMDENNQKEKGNVELINKTRKSFFSDSLKDFKDEYGVVPESIAHLIMAVTQLEDQESAYKILYNYFTDLGEDFPTESDFKNPKLRVNILANYLQRVATIENILDLVESLEICNIEAKKKHGKQRKRIGPPPKVSKRHLLDTFRQNFQEALASKQPPS